MFEILDGIVNTLGSLILMVGGVCALIWVTGIGYILWVTRNGD